MVANKHELYLAGLELMNGFCALNSMETRLSGKAG